MLKDPIKRRITLSYLFDWILVIIMTVVFFAIDNITPFHRQFSIHDKTIMFPYAEHERVPVWLLLVICLSKFNFSLLTFVYIDHMLCYTICYYWRNNIKWIRI